MLAAVGELVDDDDADDMALGAESGALLLPSGGEQLLSIQTSFRMLPGHTVWVSPLIWPT